MKKKCSIMLFILFTGVFMLFAMGSASDVDSSKYDTSKIYNVGDTLDCPSFDITVDKVTIKPKGTRIDDYQVIDDQEWIGVILTIKNKSSETKTFNSSKVELINSNGEVLNHTLLTYKIWGAELLNSPELISGGSKKGYIQYANNTKDNSNLILQVDCNTGFFDDSIVYKVNVSQ